jgi:hypothetical protein
LIVCNAVLVFPQSSVAVHVRVILYSEGHVPGVFASLKVNDTNGSQRSVAVGVVNAGVAGHSMVVGPGSAPITGGVVSSTLMVCDAVLVLPQSSVAVHVRVTLYSAGQAPGVVTSLKVNVGVASNASVTVGVVKTGVFGHSIVLGPGKAEITGATLSTRIVMAFEVAGFPVGHV